MVYTERADMAAVSRGTSHVIIKQRCKYTTSVDIQKMRNKKLVTHVESHTEFRSCVKVEAAVLGFPS